jgi:hypothetical protein
MCSVAVPAHPCVSISVNTDLLLREAASPSLKAHARSSSFYPRISTSTSLSHAMREYHIHLQRAMTRAPRTRARYTPHMHTCATRARAGTARVRGGGWCVHRRIRARLEVRMQYPCHGDAAS